MFHHFQDFSPDDQHFDDFCHSQRSNACLISGISYYDLGGEGNLFNMPEPIIEPPLVTLDDMASAMSMISCGEDTISQELKVTDVESLQSEDFLCNLFYECKDFLAKETSSPSEVLNFEHPITTDDSIVSKENAHPPGQITKSLSSDSLSSVDGAHSAQIRPSFLNFTEMDLKVYGMRRAFSEGYIKPQLISDHTSETRMQKLSRYRDKKTKRNFGRKIKYACRKALADGQPRIRGRFAKTEETDISRK